MGLQHQDTAMELRLLVSLDSSQEVVRLLEHALCVCAWLAAECARGRVVLRPPAMWRLTMLEVRVELAAAATEHGRHKCLLTNISAIHNHVG
jgi:hypothetical protein